MIVFSQSSLKFVELTKPMNKPLHMYTITVVYTYNNNTIYTQAHVYEGLTTAFRNSMQHLRWGVLPQYCLNRFPPIG